SLPSQARLQRTLHMRLRGRAIFTAFAMLVVAARATHAQTDDIIRGRVIGPDDAPVANARVTATSLQGAITRTARTDKDGRFSIAFPGDEGDYFVAFAAIGFAARRMEVKRLADEPFLRADVKLAASVAKLDAVEVQASRGRPDRDAPP